MKWTIETLLSHAYAYGQPEKRNVEVNGKHQALVDCSFMMHVLLNHMLEDIDHQEFDFVGS